MSSLLKSIIGHISGSLPEPEKLMKEGWRQEKQLKYETENTYEENLQKYKAVRSIYLQAYRLGNKKALISIGLLTKGFMEFIVHTYVIEKNPRTEQGYDINRKYSEIAIRLFGQIKDIYIQVIREISETSKTDTRDQAHILHLFGNIHNNLGTLLCSGLVAKKTHGTREIDHHIVDPDYNEGLKYLEVACKTFNDYTACRNIAIFNEDRAFRTRLDSSKIEFYKGSIEWSFYFIENVNEENTARTDIVRWVPECIEKIKECNDEIFNLSEEPDVTKESYRDEIKKRLAAFTEKFNKLYTKSAAGTRGGKSLTMKSIRTSKKTRNYKKGRRHKKSRRGRIRK